MPPTTEAANQLLRPILDCSDNAPPIQHKLEMLRSLRAATPELNDQFDKMLLGGLHHKDRKLRAGEQALHELEQVLGKLQHGPWLPAVVVGKRDTGNGRPRLEVQHDNRRRVVDALGDVDLDHVGLGDEVYLDAEAAAVVAVAGHGAPRFGETAAFDRVLGDGRAVVKHRDEEQVVQLAEKLDGSQLHHGDLVRWDRQVGIVYEKIERSAGDHMLLEETPSDTFDEIGGLDEQIATLRSRIGMQVHQPELIEKYGLAKVGSVMLIGPPGNGKTKIARALANWLADSTGAGRSFMINVKPGQMRSMWYGQTENNYRELFRVARRIAQSNPGVPVVIFLDEVDSIGSMRGAGVGNAIDDRVLPALMAEVDGLTSRGNVWLLSATNRRDTLDPALLRPGRLGDHVMEVGRPTMRAARDIFTKYLRDNLPYARNGHGDDLDATRREMIDAAVSYVYSPNGDSHLATVQFRDGSQREVRAADLVSGAIIANSVTEAARLAAQRESSTGCEGVQIADLTTALAGLLESAAAALSPHNCKHHLTDLPDDAHVVAVTRAERRIRNQYTYLVPG